MREIEIIRYTPELKQVWNDFVESSKNGTFLFNRDYMDYHSDRFEDHSYLFYHKGRPYCLLPANRKDDTLYSHQGLTYGGLIMNDSCTAEEILKVFEILEEKCKTEGIKKFIYKPVPHIYHRYPSEEDLYALFRWNARIICRNISSTVYLPEKLKLSRSRKEGLRHARKTGLTAQVSNDYAGFWKILEDNLASTYNAKPVHSLKEIHKLSCLFPHNIKLVGAFNTSQEMIGGILVYITPMACHTQYISANPEGKKYGAIDIIMNKVLEENLLQLPEDIRYFDFGSSNEDGGRKLNESLIFQKQGFGGRGISYDTYEFGLRIR